jgi:hypothetical protein
MPRKRISEEIFDPGDTPSASFSIKGQDDIGDFDDGFEPLTKSKWCTFRVDPETWGRLRRAALRVDKKPSDWIRQAINAHLKKSEKK